MSKKVPQVNIDISKEVSSKQRPDPRAPVGASYAKHKIVVMSGKGGVGKSTVAANLATTLADQGYHVGIVDFDLTGPSIPKILGIESADIKSDPTTKKLIPVKVQENLLAMSLHYFIKSDSAVIWRGAMKFKAIRNFLSQVEWGTLDYLIMDLPPGTSDEPITVAQQIPDPDGAVIVTTPQDVSTQDVRKSIIFAHKMKIPILGIIENMSNFICPHCGTSTSIFKQFGGKKLAESMQVYFLGAIPLDPEISEGGDAGIPFVKNPDNSPAKAFKKIVERLLINLSGNIPPPVY